MARSTEAGAIRRATIYRAAAAHLARVDRWSPFACDCIGWASGWFGEPAVFPAADRQEFLALKVAFCVKFSPTGEYDHAATFFGKDTEKNRETRVLALCFMAAMVEAGDA